MRKITRRDFLKYGLGSAAMAGLAESLTGCFGPAPEITHNKRPSALPAVLPSTCLLCPAGCGILGEISEKRLVRVIGNPWHPNNQGKLCARGHAAVNILYDPDRLLTPLKRSGKRGEGRWKSIPWEEALDEIATRLGNLYQSGKTEALWVEMGAPGSHELLALHFFKALGLPTIFPDNSFPEPNRSLGMALTWGAGTAVADVPRSRYILNFGSNPFEDEDPYIYLAKNIVEARMTNAAKLVTFDPRLSNTAGRSEEWFPIQPGTEGIVALALAQHIVAAGLHDQEFLTRWTNVPIAKLTEHLARYTPDRAEKISGVKANDLRRLAVEFAKTQPATTLTGRGLRSHQNGVQSERCVALLNAVVGNIDIAGGFCLPRTMDLGEPQFEGTFSSSVQAFAALQKKNSQPEFYFSFMSNPAYANPGSAEVQALLQDEKQVPFSVAADTHLTETAQRADIVLPVASYLETWNLESRPAVSLIPFVSIRQPLIPPLGQSMAIGDVCLALAKRIGGKAQRGIAFRNSEDFIKKIAGQIEGLKGDESFEALRKNGVWLDPGAKPVYRSFVKTGFSTLSGKMEIFSQTLQEKGQPALPEYVPIPSYEGLKEDEWILLVTRANVMTPRLANAKWLAEILHENPLWINQQVAGARGIREGDWVKITSATGSLIVRVRLAQGLHPRVVTLADGLGHQAFGNVAQAKRVKSSDFDTHLLFWDQEGNGVNPNVLIRPEFDESGGGFAWNDTKVTLKKLD